MMEEISLGPRLKTCFPTTKVKAIPNGAAIKHPPSQRHCWLVVCFEEEGGGGRMSCQLSHWYHIVTELKGMRAWLVGTA